MNLPADGSRHKAELTVSQSPLPQPGPPSPLSTEHSLPPYPNQAGTPEMTLSQGSSPFEEEEEQRMQSYSIKAAVMSK